MARFLSVSDLVAFAPDLDEAKANAMIVDAEALALLAAPCLADDDFANGAALVAILRGAVLRWLEAGTGAYQAQQAGPFGVTMDTRQERRSMFWPSEITQLQSLCASSSSGAYAIDTLPTGRAMHADICALVFGAHYCSCGASLTLGYPLWEWHE